MSFSRFCVPPRGGCVLALCLACSSAGTGPRHAASVEAPAQSFETPAAPVAASVPGLGDSRPAPSSSIRALEQMLTAQALLVSLLLTPFSKDRAQDAGRVDAPRAAMGSPTH
jgi:hypothetical protein